MPGNDRENIMHEKSFVLDKLFCIVLWGTLKIITHGKNDGMLPSIRVLKGFYSQRYGEMTTIGWL